MGSDSSTKHLIVGTAGHVDHGKTTLIKAMTGTNTDRLREEQERGLTIDLGFASLKLPSGLEVGIVDVPGHERFLKNMLAGASGVDIVMLVVAADEGVMPQTREHMEILSLLETGLGVVALTKIDMVDDEWIDVVEEDLREYLKGTFLDGAKIIRVSGVTGAGIKELAAEIDRLADIAHQKSIDGPFRLPIDRVFSMTGFGTVVTGTLASGTMRLGDPVVVLPQRMQSRVRQLQVHGKKQEIVYAGTRVAANLVGLEVSDIERGSVVVPPGYLQAIMMLDASVTVLKESPRSLKNRARVRMHVGTIEAIGRAVILGAEEIAPGERGFVQIRLEKEIVAARGDRFVLRFYSPPRVMGGGTVLDSAATRHRRKDQGIIQRLERRLKGEPTDIVEDALAASEVGLAKKDIIQRTGLINQEVDTALEELIVSGRVFELSGRFLQNAAYEMISSRVKSMLASYHEANPIKAGMPKEELRAAIGPRMDQKSFGLILSSVASSGDVVVSERNVRLSNHTPTPNPRQEKLLGDVLGEYVKAGANPPLIYDIESKYGPEAKEILALMLERGDIVKIAPDIAFHRDVLAEAENAIRSYLATNGQITVAQFRDLVGSSRKYVVPLLEYFDEKKVTRRAGDVRTLFKQG
ncbi:MAG: selenocysteine-specific translation elongation factor [Armatimonadota bacterium]|nr:selenocysteine-specific translation elongation factor [bacterium]